MIRLIRVADWGSGMAVMFEGFGYWAAKALAWWISSGRISRLGVGRDFRVKVLEPVMVVWWVRLKDLEGFLVGVFVVCLREKFFEDFFEAPWK